MNTELDEARRKVAAIYLDTQTKLGARPKQTAPNVSDLTKQAENNLASLVVATNKTNDTTRSSIKTAYDLIDKTNEKARLDFENVSDDAAATNTLTTYDTKPNTEAADQLRRTTRTGNEGVGDASRAVIGGVGAIAGGFTGTIGTAAAGYMNLVEAASGNELTKPDDVVNFLSSITGQDKLKNWVTSGESDVTKQKRQEFADILNSTSLTEVEKGLQVGKYFATNLDMLGLDTLKVLPQSVGEALLGIKAVNAVRGLSGLGIAGKAGVAAGGTAFGNNLYQVAQDPDNNIDGRSVLASAAVGGIVGGVTGGAAGLVKNGNVDRLLAGGGTKEFAGGSGLLTIAKAMSTEAGTEFVQEFGENVVNQIDKGENPWENSFANAVTGAALGASSAGLMASPAVIASKSAELVSKANEQLGKRDAKKNGTTEENLDPNNTKHNPRRVLDNALAEISSPNEELRTKAEKDLAESLSVVQTKLASFDEQIDATTDSATKQALVDAKQEYITKYRDPLYEGLNAYINSAKQNRDSFISTMKMYMADRQARAEKASAYPSMSLEEMTAQASQGLQTEIEASKARLDSTRNNVDYTNVPEDDQPRIVVGGSQLSTNGRTKLANAANAVSQRSSAFQEASKEYGVPLALLTGLVAQESGGDFTAKSSTGALGLLQQTSGFRKQYGLSKEDSINATPKAIAASAAALASGYKAFGNWHDAVTAYNAGEAGLRQYKAGTHKGNANRLKEIGEFADNVFRYSNGLQDTGKTSTQTSTARAPVSTYIRYDNANANRNEKLDSNLENKLGFLSGMGITFRVSSGGQSDTSKDRVGSSAHNHGHAGDGDLYIGDRKLDWNKVEDKAIFAKVIEEAASRGINGIGAGYMGAGRVHFGIQAKSVAWGSGKTAKSPPYKWVAEAIARGKARAPSDYAYNADGSVDSDTGFSFLESPGNPELSDNSDILEMLLNTENDMLPVEETVSTETVPEKSAEITDSTIEINKDKEIIEKTTKELEVLNTQESNFEDGTKAEIIKMLENKIVAAEERISSAEQTSKSFTGSPLEDTAQDIANQKVIMRQTRAVFPALTPEEIDSNPVLNDSQKTAVKQLNTFNSTMNTYVDNLPAKKTMGAVQGDIYNGYKGATTQQSNLGLKDYDSTFKIAFASGDVNTVNKYLGYLNRFAENHTDKLAMINDALAKGASMKEPQYLVVDAQGKWINTDVAAYNESVAKGGRQFKVIGDNLGTRAVEKEEKLLREAVTTYTDGATALLGNEVRPFVAPKSNGIVAPTPVTPVPVPASAGTGTPTGNQKGSNNQTPPVSSQSPTGNGSATYAKVIKTTEDQVPADGFWISRSGTGKDTRSLGNVKTVEDVGKRGWLAMGSNMGDAKQNMAAYIGRIKTLTNPKNDFAAEFVEALIALKGKTLYSSRASTENSEVGFIAELLEIMPDNYAEATTYLQEIESYSDKSGIVMKGENTADTDEDGENAPVRSRHDSNEIKKRSAAPVKGAKKGTKAKRAMTTKNSRSEISSNTLQETDNYSNMYVGVNAKGVNEQITIKRKKGSNEIISITSTVEGTNKSNAYVPKDATMSDELWLTTYEEARELDGYVQENLNTYEDRSNVEFEGHSLPVELVDKTVDLAEVIELYSDDIESTEAVKDDERSLLTAIIKPIINFNPKVKLKISKGSKANSYDEDTNTIEINLPMTEGNVLQEIARLLVSSTTSKVANELELMGSSDMVLDLNVLYNLNQDLSAVRRAVDRVIRAEDGRFTKLNDNTKDRILNAMFNNGSFLATATTDINIAKFLQTIASDEKKVKQSLFARVVSSLRSFMGVGSGNKIKTQFDALLNVTLRTATEQARNKEVNFKASPDAVVSALRGMDESALAIVQKQELNKPFTERNQFLATFTQKQIKGKPLSSISNLVDKLRIDLMQGLQQLVSEAPNKAQREQLEDFVAFEREFTVHLLEAFKNKRERKYLRNPDKTYKVDAAGHRVLNPNDYGYEDMKAYLMDENGDIDKNTLSAMAVVAYDYIIENGNKTQNMDKDIKGLLNLEPDDTAYIAPAIKETYLHRGGLKPFAINKVGKKGVSMLNIKATESASAETQSRLENSVGEWVLSAMQGADLIHITTIESKVHEDNIKTVGGDLTNFNSISERGVVSFISITTPDGMNINPRLYEIVKKNAGTLGYLGKVFGTDIGLRPPVLEAPTSVITKIKRTISTMSLTQRQYVKKMQEEPIRINEDMLNTFQGLLKSNRDITLQMIGAQVSEEKLASTHVNKRFSLTSAADGVMRGVESALDFTNSLNKDEDGKITKFFDFVYAAKNNRMHYLSNMFNFQSDKFHRSLGEYENFNNNIDIGEVTEDYVNILDEKGQISGAAFFLRAVAESAEGTEKLMKAALESKGFTLGFTVDKIDSINFIDPFYQYLRTDTDVQTAVRAMSRALDGAVLSKVEVESIAKVVNFWEGEANSLRALLEYTKFQTAVDSGNVDTFNTSLGLGSDGINNGSAISYTQLGSGNDKFFAQVGMLMGDGEYSGYNNYLETRTNADIGDYYTGFSPFIQSALNGVDPRTEGKKEKESDAQFEKRIEEFDARTVRLNRLIALNPSLKKRALLKAVLIPFGYSAGMKRLKALVFGQFMTDIESQLEEVANMDRSTPANVELANTAHTALEGKLAALLDKEVNLPQGKQLLEYWLDFSDINTLRINYDADVGNSVVTALKNYADSFMKQRDFNVKMQGAAYKVYETMKEIIEKREKAIYVKSLLDSKVYEKYTEEAIKEIVAMEGIPLTYYNKHIKHKIDNIRPSIMTPFNRDTQDWFDDSDFMIPDEVTTLKADPSSAAVTWKVNKFNEYVGSNVNVPIVEKGEKSTGVMVNSAQVQGVDAIIAAVASAFGGNVNINVHDAGISGLLNYITMTKQQNKSTFEALRDYHAQTSSLLALSEAVNSLTTMLKQGEIETEAYNELMVDSLAEMFEYKEAEAFKEKAGKLNDTDKAILFADTIKDMIQNTKRTENRKLKNLDRMTIIHQYGGEGGEYHITAEDKKGIETQYIELKKLFNEINTNFKALFSPMDEYVTTEDETTNSDNTQKDIVISTIDEVQIINNLLSNMESMVSESRYSIHKYLIGKLSKQNKVTTKSIDFNVTNALGRDVRGNYDVTTNTINISKTFVESATVDELTDLLNHELFHAVSVINMNSNNDPVVTAATKVLRDMQEYLQMQAMQQGERYLANKVFVSAEEMVAYGMTDEIVMKFMLDNLKGTKFGLDKDIEAPKATRGLMKFFKSVYSMITGNKAVSNTDGGKQFEVFVRMVDMVTTTYTADQAASYSSSAIYNSTANLTNAEVLRQLSSVNVTREHNEHLNDLIQVIENFESLGQAQLDTVDQIISAVNHRAINAGFKMSDKELHVMEIVKVIGETFLTTESGTATAEEVRRVYRHALKNMDRDVFLDNPATATPAEKRIAQGKWNYVFKQDNINKVEQYERFMALAVSSQDFQKYLAKLDNNRKPKEQDNLFGKMMNAFANMMRWSNGRILKTYGQDMPTEMKTLFSRLNEINIRARTNHVNLLDKSVKFTTGLITTPANYATNKILAGIFKTFDFARGSSNQGIRNMGNAMYNMQGQEISDVVETGINLNTSLTKVAGSNRRNALGELLYEFGRNKNMKLTTEELIRMSKKAEQDRHTVATESKKALTKYFKNVDNISKAALASITQVALRTDATALMRHGMSITSLMKLLKSPTERSTMIARLEAEISSNANANDILLQTKALGMYMAKEVAAEHLVKNVESIAIGLGSWYESDISTMDTNLRDSIDQLASLYAIEFTTAEQQAELSKMIDEQPEGIKAMLNYHLEMVNQSKIDFENNSYNYSKGYMPQRTHELRSLKFAQTPEEITVLEAKGWTIVGDEDLSQDSSDGTEARTLMFHNDMLYQDYVSGALDMKDTHAKGTMVYSVVGNLAEVNQVSGDKIASRRKRNNTNFKNFNFEKQAEGNMIASYDSEGNLTGYHYEMSGRLRDTYLERDSNAIELMGMMSSNLHFKPVIGEVQREVANVLHEDYLKSYAKDPRLFVTLDPESSDPNVATMWRMMPYEFRAEAEKLFGNGNPIVVRSSVYNTVFGYRTYSMSDMFNKLHGDRNAFEKFVTSVLTAIFQDKAEMRVLQGERMWQKGIKQMKDFIVIRNLRVLMGNIVSNSLMLSAHGVSITQQTKDFVSVWANGGRYRKLAARVKGIDAELAINKNRPKELTRLNRARNLAMIEMERNPLHDFMEAGLMSSIVEDTAVFAEDTGFQSDLDKRLDKYAGYLPDQVITGFNWVMMSPGTPLHNFASHATQFSDLAAKYSLTKHRVRNGDTTAVAIGVAQDNFINYDVPTGRGLDYMNKMGLFMFTKFIIRFQQALMTQLSTRAGSVIAQHMFIEHFTNQAGILEPFMLNRLGNPMSAGLLNYGSAWSNISTVDFLLGLGGG